MIAKLKYLGTTNSNLTQNGIYVVQSETETNYTVTDDLAGLFSVLKTQTIPHWEINSLSQLVTSQAFTTDSYGTTFKIVSNDTNALRVNSDGRTTSELSQVSFTKQFGDVTRCLAVLQSTYRFSILYTQDPLKVFNDLDSLVLYASSIGWKVCVLPTMEIIITDSTGTKIIPEMLGISITF